MSKVHPDLEPTLCACGCDEIIIPRWHHGMRRYTRFKLYHHARLQERSTTDAREAEIAKRYANGEKACSLAEEFNVAAKAIYNILDRYKIPRQHITSQNRYSCNEAFFDIIDNESKAYWLGFVAADGYVYNQPGKGYCLLIKLNPVDTGHLAKFKHDIDTDAPIADYSHYVPPFHRISVSSKQLVTGLVSHGIIQAKSTVLEFPTTVPTELLRHFIRGYFDGDGSVYYGSRGELLISFVGTRNMMQNIRDVVAATCFVNYAVIGKQKGKNLYRIAWHCRAIRQILRYMYEGSTVFLNRKMAFYSRVQGSQLVLPGLGIEQWLPVMSEDVVEAPRLP